jgi:Arc/MetJ family transcription regulator
LSIHINRAILTHREAYPIRTNIEIDDKLIVQAMKATGTTTKKAAVEASLRKLIAIKIHERDIAEHFRLQQIARQEAEREGRLEEWFTDLKKNGNCPKSPTRTEG